MCDATDFHSNQIQNKTKDGNEDADPFLEKLNLWREGISEVGVFPFQIKAAQCHWTTNDVTLLFNGQWHSNAEKHQNY